MLHQMGYIYKSAHTSACKHQCVDHLVQIWKYMVGVVVAVLHGITIQKCHAEIHEALDDYAVLYQRVAICIEVF